MITVGGSRWDRLNGGGPSAYNATRYPPVFAYIAGEDWNMLAVILGVCVLSLSITVAPGLAQTCVLSEGAVAFLSEGALDGALRVTADALDKGHSFPTAGAAWEDYVEKLIAANKAHVTTGPIKVVVEETTDFTKRGITIPGAKVKVKLIQERKPASVWVDQDSLICDPTKAMPGSKRESFNDGADVQRRETKEDFCLSKPVCYGFVSRQAAESLQSTELSHLLAEKQAFRVEPGTKLEILGSQNGLIKVRSLESSRTFWVRKVCLICEEQDKRDWTDIYSKQRESGKK